MFINLTPHAIVIRPEGMDEIVVEPSGTIARVEVDEVDAGKVAGVPVYSRSAGEVLNIPDREDNVYLIVSGMVLSAVPHGRTDIVAPDTGATAVRNEKGQVVAATRLVSN